MSEISTSGNPTAMRQRRIYRVTIAGGIINALLLAFKFAAGIIAGSAAMIADAVHSLSDFLTDIVVLVFVRVSSKPRDKDHDYGHGKYETLATAIIGMALMCVGVMILYNGVTKTWSAINGATLESPGLLAFVAAVVSIVMKEWAFRFTRKVGEEVQSQAVVANAWHHRSDAFSSIGTAFGIGGAIALGERWAVLDPIAAVIVSFFILKAAYGLMAQATKELLEESLSDAIEQEIVSIAEGEENVTQVHNLRTRHIGNNIAIEMHLRLPGNMTLYDAHNHAINIENKLRERFGGQTHIGLHLEPLKVDGRYVEPNDSGRAGDSSL